jgi:hypothetical protein
MRKSGDSYYVLINNKDEVYVVDDIIEGELIVDFEDEDEAIAELQYLIDEGELEETDGWHVERHRW